MTRFEIIVIVLLAVNGFWNFCIMGLLNALNQRYNAMMLTISDGLHKIADAERKEKEL